MDMTFLIKALSFILMPLFGTAHDLGFCFQLGLDAVSEDQRPNNDILKTENMDNLPDCVRECVYDVRCVSVFFKKIGGVCVLVDKPATEIQSDNDNGWLGFELPFYPMSSTEGGTGSSLKTLWVDEVTNFSSQYDQPGNERFASYILGPNDVYPQYGDLPGAWSPAYYSLQWIQVKLAEQLRLTKIEVYETYNAGAFVQLSSLLPDDRWWVLWTARYATRIKRSLKTTLKFYTVSDPYISFKIYVDGRAAYDKVAIDAVSFTGLPL